MTNVIRTDCRHYRGEIPCTKRKVCWSCDEFEPIPRRALVIKFGAAGDALRTTPIVSRLRKEGYGEITWICDAASHEVLSLAEGIDRLVVHGPDSMPLVMTEIFDGVFSFDKAPPAIALATLAKSPDRRGFCANSLGRLSVFDERSRYALRLGMDDDLKFRDNAKSVPRILFEMAGFEYAGEEYSLRVPDPVEKNDRAVALNLGVGPRWPTKAWPREHWISLAKLLRRDGFHPVFAGGPHEDALIRECAAEAEAEFFPPSPLAAFARMLAGCRAAVTGDSLGLHVALAAKTPAVVGLFCSTASAEIEWFGRGEAIVAPDGPCYNARCGHWPGCMKSISPDQILSALRRRLPS